ncbi:MAG: GNAT family N-acetyltransferase [Clostridia bacterium]|nr:GNAT family N-acetyltransferase [Clostridia bacterium]
MEIRKAKETDIDAITQIYSDIHTAEEQGEVTIGWIRGVYPTEQTARDALQRDDLFVMGDEGKVVGAAVINQCQVDVYAQASWEHEAKDEEVMVLHTLVISPKEKGKGYGKAFVSYYENYARERNCPYLRIDTNARNVNARKLYEKLGYREIDILPCDFNGIGGVNMVLLEKSLIEK